MRKPINLSTMLPKVRTIDWGVDTTNYLFYKLNELQLGGRYAIKGMYVQNSQYGKQGVIISDGFFVSLPKHLTEFVEAVMDSPEAIEDIKAGGYTFATKSYDVPTHNTTAYTIEVFEPVQAPAPVVG